MFWSAGSWRTLYVSRIPSTHADVQIRRWLILWRTVFGSFRTRRWDRILDLAGAFSQEWRQRLENETGGQLSESVNSIVGNRHKIAHGDSVGLTLHSLIQYYGDALRVVDLLRQQCGL